MAVDIVEDLLEKGVYHLIFCRTWYNDETLCHILEMYNKEFQNVATRLEFEGNVYIRPEKHHIVIDYDYLNIWGYKLSDHVVLWNGEPQTIKNLDSIILFFDVYNNEVTTAGRMLQSADYDTEAPFIFCQNPEILYQSWRSTNKAQLYELSRHPDEFVRLCVAKNPLTTQSTLESMMGDLSFEVAETAKSRFENQSKWFWLNEDLQRVKTQILSVQELEHAARHQWSQVQLACLQHPNIDDYILGLLAQHHEWEIQLEVFSHPKASEKTRNKALEKLLVSSVSVQIRLAEHRKSSAELLEAIEKIAKDERVLARIALHPNNKKHSRFVD